MMRLYFLILFLIGSATAAFSQASNCTQVLRLARTTYEQGRLHELPGLVKDCLEKTKGGFTKEERKETYRLLTLSYIYLEEPEEADKAMLNLLETDHFFEVNPALDPAEFIALYKKFRTTPLFRVGIKLGVNATQPSSSVYYNVASESGGHGSYGLSPSFQLLATFEKEITKNITLAPEVGLVARGFSYTNDNLNLPDFSGFAQKINKLEYSVSQSWLDLNVLGQYNLTKSNLKFPVQQWYVGAGPGISYLLSSSNQPQTTLNGQQVYAVTGQSVDDKECYNKLVYSATAIVGYKRRIGEIYLILDARYQVGLSNVVNPASRTNQELSYDYQIQYNDYRMSNFMVNLGILYPYFKPRKLIK